MRILAIESSHDDTSVALYESRRVTQEVTIRQTGFHNQFGGTIPEFAARYHAVVLPRILAQFNLTDLSAIDAVAYTALPGLTGSLQMGMLAAQAIGLALTKPVVPVNHLHAHVFAAGFSHTITYPALALVVSGGHTQILLVQSPRDVTVILNTADDAVGEVFDKVARALGLAMPGGPAIEKLAQTNALPRLDFASSKKPQYGFSFSGLKTKVRTYIAQHELITEAQKAQVAASFQYQIVRQICAVVQTALAYHPETTCLILGGGVAANQALRTAFSALHPRVLLPDLAHTTDSAGMIAIMADYLLMTTG